MPKDYVVKIRMTNTVTVPASYYYVSEYFEDKVRAEQRVGRLRLEGYSAELAS